MKSQIRQKGISAGKLGPCSDSPVRDRLWALMHIEGGPHAMAGAVAVVEAHGPERGPRQGVQRQTWRPRRKHRLVQGNVPLRRSYPVAKILFCSISHARASYICKRANLHSWRAREGPDSNVPARYVVVLTQTPLKAIDSALLQRCLGRRAQHI